MITRADLNNLGYLITKHLDEKILSPLRFHIRKARRWANYLATHGRLPPKRKALKDMTVEDIFFPIIRNSHPSSIAGQLFVDWPMKKPEPEEKVTRLERVPFNEISISGGWRHTFGQGFSYASWMLVQETGEQDVCNVPKFGLKIVQHRRVLEKLWPSWRVDLPEKTRARWQAIADRHSRLIEEQKAAQDR